LTTLIVKLCIWWQRRGDIHPVISPNWARVGHTNLPFITHMLIAQAALSPGCLVLSILEPVVANDANQEYLFLREMTMWHPSCFQLDGAGTSYHQLEQSKN